MEKVTYDPEIFWHRLAFGNLPDSKGRSWTKLVAVDEYRNIENVLTSEVYTESVDFYMLQEVEQGFRILLGMQYNVEIADFSEQLYVDYMKKYFNVDYNAGIVTYCKAGPRQRTQ